MKTMILNSKVKAVSKFCTPEESRYALHGVCLTMRNGYPLIMATDGHRAIQVVDMTNVEPEQFPTIPGFDSTPDPEAPESVLIPMESWNKGMTTPTKGKKGLPFMHQVAVKVGQDTTTLASTDLDVCSVVPTRNIAGQFPNMDMVMPKPEGNEIRIQVGLNAEYLAEACQVIKGLHGDKGVGLVIELQVPRDLRKEGDYYSPTKPAMFLAKGDDFFAKVVIMPMRITGKEEGYFSDQLPVKLEPATPLTSEEVKALEIIAPESAGEETDEVVTFHVESPLTGEVIKTIEIGIGGPDDEDDEEDEREEEEDEEFEEECEQAWNALGAAFAGAAVDAGFEVEPGAEEVESTTAEEVIENVVSLDPIPAESAPVSDVVARARAKLGLTGAVVPFIPPVAPPTNGATKPGASFRLSDLM